MLVYLLGACQAPAPSTTPLASVTASLTPTDLATLSALDAKNTQIAQNYLTREARATATPTTTPTPIPTVYSTFTPAPTPTPGVATFWYEPFLSPDGKWEAMAYQTFVDGQTRLFLVVRRLDGSIEWVVDDVEYVDEIFSPSYFPVPQRWSSNGRYFYFSHTRAGDGCWPSFLAGLARVDLSSGEVREVSKDAVLDFVFSPNERYLAYFSGVSLTVLDVKTDQMYGVRYVSTSDGNYLADVDWSPDGSSILVTVTYQTCVSDEPVTILRYDLANGTQTVLVENAPYHNLRIEQWVERTSAAERFLWWLVESRHPNG